jgi:hypothetical protein
MTLLKVSRVHDIFSRLVRIQLVEHRLAHFVRQELSPAFPVTRKVVNDEPNSYTPIYA